MTEPRADEAVHQAFFGWSHSHQKLDLISYSFQGLTEGPSWRRKLEEHARLQPSGKEKPVSSLSYLDLEDGYVAVLRRVAQGHTPGRNNSHALIAPAAAIDVRVALGLGGWDGWREIPPEDQYMQAYHVNQIAPFASHAERLRPHIEQHERGLGVVLAQLLDNPGLPLSIIGCPNQHRLPIVWGLQAAAANWLHESGHPRWFTFSTYEVHHHDNIRCLPEIVFLPERPLGAGNVTRTIVDLDTEPQASANSTVLASQLLAAVFRGTASPAPKAMRETVHAGAPVHGAAVSAHSNHFEQRTDGHGVPTQQPAAPRRVDALLQAKSVKDFEARLAVLEATTTQWPQHRQELRAELDLGTMNSVAHFIEHTATHELIKRLLKITYGPQFEDLDVAGRQHANTLIRDGGSDRLAMVLGRTADRQVLRDAALDRAARPTVTRRASQRPAGSGNRWLPYVLTAIVLLGLVFVLGILVGRPDPAQPTSGPQAGGTPDGSGPTPTTLASSPPTIGNFTVTTPAQDGKLVFGFVEQGSTLYPQATCALQNKPATWNCPVSWQPQEHNPPDLQRVAFKVSPEDEAKLKKAAGEKKSVEPEVGWQGPISAHG